MTILPTSIYRLNETPIKLPVALFAELEQTFFILCKETQKIPNSQIYLDKEKWNGRNQAPWLETTLPSDIYQNNIVLAQPQK